MFGRLAMLPPPGRLPVLGRLATLPAPGRLPGVGKLPIAGRLFATRFPPPLGLCMFGVDGRDVDGGRDGRFGEAPPPPALDAPPLGRAPPPPRDAPPPPR